MRVLVGAASLVIVVAGLKAAAPLLIPIVVASFLAVASFPLLQSIRRREVPTGIAVAFTGVIVVLLLLGPVALVTVGGQQFARAAPGYQQQLVERYTNGLAWLKARGVDTTTVETISDRNRLFGMAMSSLPTVARLARDLRRHARHVLLDLHRGFDARQGPDRREQAERMIELGQAAHTPRSEDACKQGIECPEYTGRVRRHLPRTYRPRFVQQSRCHRALFSPGNGPRRPRQMASLCQRRRRNFQPSANTRVRRVIRPRMSHCLAVATTLCTRSGVAAGGSTATNAGGSACGNSAPRQSSNSPPPQRQ